MEMQLKSEEEFCCWHTFTLFPELNKLCQQKHFFIAISASTLELLPASIAMSFRCGEKNHIRDQHSYADKTLKCTPAHSAPNAVWYVCGDVLWHVWLTLRQGMCVCVTERLCEMVCMCQLWCVWICAMLCGCKNEKKREISFSRCCPR